MKNYNELWFKDILETTLTNCGFKENFENIFKTIIVVIKNILKIILKLQCRLWKIAIDYDLKIFLKP